jgi:hypothetical protein
MSQTTADQPTEGHSEAERVKTVIDRAWETL